MPTSFPPSVGDWSPWGAIDVVSPLGPDAVVVGTASHGGVRVSAAAHARMAAPLRATRFSHDGWYEEDCDWCLPYLALGLHAFEADPVRAVDIYKAAQMALERHHPALVAVIDATRARAPAR